MNPDEFRVFSYQATIWTADYEPGIRKVMGLAIGPWAERFDSEPSVLPPAPELPPDLPRFSVASRDRSWKLQISPRRVNIFWERRTVQDAPPDDFAAVAFQTLKPYLDLSDEMRVTRLAYVVKRYQPDENASRTLAQYFCREEHLRGPLNRPEQFQLHAHKVYTPPDSPKVNSWIRWRTAELTLGDESQLVVTVEQDLNTLAEVMAQTSFSSAEISAFLDSMVAEAESIVALYLRPQ